MAETVAPQQQQSDDERRLAELGYTQALQRSWSSFSNFAISFTIISVLAGCFTTYGQAWNNGGPIAISWGWPIICGLILLVAFSMSELVSAYPTAGGIYYWASTLGGPKWGWFTGWFNLVGLVGVVASVDYGCAQFLNATLPCGVVGTTPYLDCNPAGASGVTVQDVLNPVYGNGGLIWNLANIPIKTNQQVEDRKVYNTRMYSQSNAGHEFTSVLTDQERRALIEYLKTL